MWNSFDAGGKMLDVLNDETARLLKAYGNHPSLVLLNATNEPAGNYQQQLPLWDKKWRDADPRRLYGDGTGRPAGPGFVRPPRRATRASSPPPFTIHGGIQCYAVAAGRRVGLGPTTSGR